MEKLEQEDDVKPDTQVDGQAFFMDAEKDDVLVEIKDGVVMMPISAQDEDGVF